MPTFCMATQRDIPGVLVVGVASYGQPQFVLVKTEPCSSGSLVFLRVHVLCTLLHAGLCLYCCMCNVGMCMLSPSGKHFVHFWSMRSFRIFFFLLKASRLFGDMREEGTTVRVYILLLKKAFLNGVILLVLGLAVQIKSLESLNDRYYVLLKETEKLDQASEGWSWLKKITLFSITLLNKQIRKHCQHT